MPRIASGAFFLAGLPRLEFIILDSTSTLFPILFAIKGEVSGLPGPFLAILAA
jgi:hypothetical protein